MRDENTNGRGHDALHTWFELSYAKYLTVPRSALQSMPDKWQGRMAALLSELDERIDWRPEDGCYYVTLNRVEEDEETHCWNVMGRELVDPLRSYERGGRRLPLKPKRPFWKDAKDWAGLFLTNPRLAWAMWRA